MQQLNYEKSKHEALKARLRQRIRQIMRASASRARTGPFPASVYPFFRRSAPKKPGAARQPSTARRDRSAERRRSRFELFMTRVNSGPARLKSTP